MERNTITTLGDLLIGDRFTFVKRTDEVWQVTGKTATHVSINQFNPAGNQLRKYDELKKRSMHVRFLRHSETPKSEAV